MDKRTQQHVGFALALLVAGTMSYAVVRTIITPIAPPTPAQVAAMQAEQKAKQEQAARDKRSGDCQALIYADEMTYAVDHPWENRRRHSSYELALICNPRARR